MTRATRSAVWLIGILLAAPASAEQGHRHAHPPGPHGGRVEGAGAWHAELVTGKGTVSVYLSDGNGKPLPVAGHTAVAILKAGGKTTRILLAPEGDRLTGKIETGAAETLTGAIRIVAPDGATGSARFD